jgi:hypothetical protein
MFYFKIKFRINCSTLGNSVAGIMLKAEREKHHISLAKRPASSLKTVIPVKPELSDLIVSLMYLCYKEG